MEACSASDVYAIQWVQGSCINCVAQARTKCLSITRRNEENPCFWMPLPVPSGILEYPQHDLCASTSMCCPVLVTTAKFILKYKNRTKSHLFSAAGDSSAYLKLKHMFLDIYKPKAMHLPEKTFSSQHNACWLQLSLLSCLYSVLSPKPLVQFSCRDLWPDPEGPQPAALPAT